MLHSRRTLSTTWFMSPVGLAKVRILWRTELGLRPNCWHTSSRVSSQSGSPKTQRQATAAFSIRRRRVLGVRVDARPAASRAIHLQRSVVWMSMPIRKSFQARSHPSQIPSSISLSSWSGI